MMVIIYMLFLLLIAWSIKRRCTRSYFCHCLILRIMHSCCEKELGSDGTYLHALFELLLAWDSKIRSVRAYFCPCFMLRRMQSRCKK